MLDRAHRARKIRRAQPVETTAALVNALELAVFERQAGERFRLVLTAPDWFRRLVPESTQPGVALPLAERFPMLEAFLPEAAEAWNSANGRSSSDFWTETLPEGGECHLLAWTLNAGAGLFLVLERADALYRERQLVLHHAHEQALQVEIIARLNREVERANRAKSDFLASMSHEIRTPLNAILGMADVLAETELTTEQREYVQVFRRAGRSLLELINDILDLAKVEAGEVRLEHIPFSLKEVLDRASELMGLRAHEKGLDLTASVTAGTTTHLVGDPTRVRQVLLNLMGNAMKFTEKGGVTVHAESDPEGGAPGCLRFAVSDSGIGIPEDKLGSIFENFSQADASTTRKYGGTGLGLAISKKLVELMGGRIWVESRAGAGSTFRFTARFETWEPAAAEVAAVAPARAERRVETASAVPLRILLADDSPDNRLLITAYLRGLPYTLDMAENGEVAAEKIASGGYDLVLMDVHMPVLDGYGAVQRVRAAERERGAEPLPILALTADAFQDAVARSQAAGFTAHLVKPISKATLLEAVAAHARQPVHAVPVQRIRVDPELADIAPAFLRNVRKNPEQLEKALARSDFDSIRIVGHNMKGTGTSFGFPIITELGGAIEEAAKEGNAERIRAKTEELFRYLEQVEVEVNQP